MSKSNKELAIDVAKAVIEANQSTVFIQDTNSGSKILCNVIKEVYKTLEELDGDQTIDIDIESLDIP